MSRAIPPTLPWSCARWMEAQDARVTAAANRRTSFLMGGRITLNCIPREGEIKSGGEGEGPGAPGPAAYHR